MNALYIYVMFLLAMLSSEGMAKKRKPNNRPTIGVLTQKVHSAFSPQVKKSEGYIAASYVKYLEMAGAQVVPILATMKPKAVRKLVRSINGALFPGGAAPLDDSPFYETASVIYHEAKKLNDKGVHFPLWGTCLGFETLHNLAAEENILMDVVAENISMELNFTQHAFRSRLFEDMDKKMMQDLMFEKITLNMHHSGISPELYGTNLKLNAMYRVLSTNFDEKGVEFVSTVEGIKYPFYGTQWHPEKNLFEWTTREAINHSPEAVAVAQYLSNFFVNEARKNFQKFKSVKEEIKHSIFKYAPIFSGGTSLFEQVYVFGNGSEIIQH
ncbi:gamma-glutamyl hydrolase A-like [Hydractinia symbiolongicarpus]|uniref:gamma-glutamyl hydrolase A-like n=1 Tax=Hydractinia symbiolongicarpus TaxID=13093 RepID=UPI00254A6D20|nr:gamma-glutamyl hydrolase A-like [Hydractinia symbiolongicarpus]